MISSITSSVCSGRVHFSKKIEALSRAPTSSCSVRIGTKIREPLPCSTIGHDFPVVVQQIVRVADFQFFRTRFPIVHEHVVGTFHVVTVQENETARNGVERVFIDAVDRLDRRQSN